MIGIHGIPEREREPSLVLVHCFFLTLEDKKDLYKNSGKIKVSLILVLLKTKNLQEYSPLSDKKKPGIIQTLNFKITVMCVKRSRN